ARQGAQRECRRPRHGRAEHRAAQGGDAQGRGERRQSPRFDEGLEPQHEALAAAQLEGLSTSRCGAPARSEVCNWLQSRIAERSFGAVNRFIMDTAMSTVSHRRRWPWIAGVAIIGAALAGWWYFGTS